MELNQSQYKELVQRQKKKNTFSEDVRSSAPSCPRNDLFVPTAHQKRQSSQNSFHQVCQGPSRLIYCPHICTYFKGSSQVFFFNIKAIIAQSVDSCCAETVIKYPSAFTNLLPVDLCLTRAQGYSPLISNLNSDPTLYCFSSSTNMNNNLTFSVKQTDDKKAFLCGYMQRKQVSYLS